MRKLTDLILRISPRLTRPFVLGVARAVMSLLLLGALSPRHASAQYMFVDVDGDGVSTSKDVLDPVWPTSLSIWLVTDHNRDGSPAACSAGSRSLTINSYEVVIRADSGSVSWGAYQNRMADFELHFGGAYSQTEFHEGYGSFSPLGPGKYLLATLEVTVISGKPRLTPSASSELAARFMTAFGSECEGLADDNTLALGRDWMDVDGVGTGTGGGDVLPQSVTANEGVVYLGGNRMAAPLTFSFESHDVVVNEGKLPGPARPTAIVPSSRDTLRCNLDSDATTLARAGVGKGLSREDILESLRSHYASSALVSEARRDGEVIKVTYVGSPSTQNLVALPASLPMTDPNEAERERLEAVRAYGRLLEAKRGLDQGGMLIISRNGWTTVPPSIAGDIDDALRYLQSGAKLSENQKQLLERTIVPDIQNEISNPIPLQVTGRSR